MNITLTPELKAMVERKVASGLYQSASEVVREALRLLEQREHAREDRQAVLRQEIAIGIKQLENGQYSVTNKENLLSEVKSEGRKRLAGMKTNS